MLAVGCGGGDGRDGINDALSFEYNSRCITADSAGPPTRLRRSFCEQSRRMRDMETDYLAQHDARLITEGSATRVLVEESNVIFVNQTPDALRQIVNHAIGFASAYFTDNLQRSNEVIQITEHQIEQVAIKVALCHLYMYNMWRNYNEEYRDHDLALTLDDLRHPYTRDETLFYCEATFPKDYQSVAASLVGTTRDEFAEWEKGRREFWDRR
jgi:hypothetical protein